MLLGPGDHHLHAGPSADVEQARRNQARPDETLLWFRQDGKAYVSRDAATLESVREAFVPVHALGEEMGRKGAVQGTFGHEQGRLGEQQGRLGALQAALGAEMARLAADRIEMTAQRVRADTGRLETRGDSRSKIDEQMRALEVRMRALGDQQRELGERMRTLSGKMQGDADRLRALGEQMQRNVAAAQQRVASLLQEAVASGRAQPTK